VSFYRAFLSNHVLANLAFVLVILVGLAAFLAMPRAKDVEVNFNWINILTVLPGASAEDIEERITDPLENAIRKRVTDVRFVTSDSRAGASNLLVRFHQIDERTFDKRVTDLRREVQTTASDELPAEVETPIVYELTASSAFPSASVVVVGQGEDENLYRQARSVKKDLERLAGVLQVTDVGLPDPELHVAFDPDQLAGLGLPPVAVADTVRAYFRDVSAGDVRSDAGQWLVRVDGTDDDPERLAGLPIVTASGVIPLSAVARLERSPEEATEFVRYKGQPAVFLTVTKRAEANVLDLVDEVNAYIDRRNELADETGVELVLADDQTVSTRRALKLMETNALIGLVLVLFVTWAFLGFRIALLTSIGIPFTLCGTFAILNLSGMSVNNNVLLGVVIALGMIVDDAVVVVESISHRLQRGMAALDAACDALAEVFAPVTTSVMTTMAAFLPLMLLPGIMGDFLRVVPLCVSLALAISLLEAYWMLPAHVAFVRGGEARHEYNWRVRFTRWIRHRYSVLLLRALRRPWIPAIVILLLVVFAAWAYFSEQIRTDFFAADTEEIFYVNVEMPRGTTLERTLDKLAEAETVVREATRPGEIRAAVTYAGQLFTDTEPLFGDTVGQVQVSLDPNRDSGRSVYEITDAIEARLPEVTGAERVTLLRLKGGPPQGKPVSVKVRGDDYDEIWAAAQRLMAFMEKEDGLYSNITTDYRPGDPQLVLEYDGDAIKRSAIDPTTLARSVALFVDGEIVASFHSEGEDVKVRVLPDIDGYDDIGDLLRQTVATPAGAAMPLADLVDYETGYGLTNIRHYNFRRTITVEADIDKARIDTVEANAKIREYWESVRTEHPSIDLDFSGILDDIIEAFAAFPKLFGFGIVLIYAILGTQFRSYTQPLMILVTVPLAFLGVTFGLFVTGNPLSLYTMYGVVALSGIAVNAAIVLISTANARRRAGMSQLHATVYAARRRVIPILITSLTTISGLLGLALGIGGRSLIWGPVATSIVAGLFFSTVLTLFVVPLLYRAAPGIRAVCLRVPTALWALVSRRFSTNA